MDGAGAVALHRRRRRRLSRGRHPPRPGHGRRLRHDPRRRFAGHGIVFRLAPNGAGWAETLVNTFSGAPDGSQPASAVVRGAAGLLYGTTEAGGIADHGAIYAVTP
jgi:uncharacterized repeat protein (TIGR03803 family)